MKFNEKMVFLMETTGTSNKVLADRINVDPSMISMLRTGKRGKPRNETHLKAMADYFAAQFHSMYQRETLAEVIGQFNLKYQSDYRDISPVLFEWLRDDNYQPPSSLERVMAGLHKLQEEDKDASLEKDSDTFTQEVLSAGMIPQETTAFYGDSGKMKAISLFQQFLLQLPDNNFTLYLTSDESNGWYLSHHYITADVKFWMTLVKKTGCRVCMILPPSSSTIFLDIIAEWLPLFLSGHFDVYYYPRTRDRIYRHTMLILENQAALFSSSIESDENSAFSVFTRDPALVGSNMILFRNFLAKCQRTFQVHFTLNEMQACFMKYVSLQTDSILFSHTLPQASMPQTCMQLMFGDRIQKEMSSENTADSPKDSASLPEKIYQDFRNTSPRRYLEHVTIEISALSTFEEVEAGKVKQVYPGNSSEQEYTYTPLTYVLHLKEIVSLMKIYPDYYFIPYRNKQYQMDNVLIKPNLYCLVIHQENPKRILEISQPALIQPFYEFLTGIADQAHYSGSGKRRIISQLEDLIDDFERHMQTNPG